MVKSKLRALYELTASTLPPYSDLYDFIGLFSIIWGMAYSLGFLNTTSGKLCKDYLEDQKDQIVVAMDEFTGETGEEIIRSYIAGINAIILIGWEINDTFTNCFEGGLDAVTVA
jgi:hypothetical protein